MKKVWDRYIKVKIEDTCKQIFGTDNYDEIQEGISVEVDEEGNKFLSYTRR